MRKYFHYWASRYLLENQEDWKLHCRRVIITMTSKIIKQLWKRWTPRDEYKNALAFSKYFVVPFQWDLADLQHYFVNWQKSRGYWVWVLIKFSEATGKFCWKASAALTAPKTNEWRHNFQNPERLSEVTVLSSRYFIHRKDQSIVIYFF